MDVRQHKPRRNANQREGLRASWSEPKIIPRIGVQGSFSPSLSSRYNRGSVSFNRLRKPEAGWEVHVRHAEV